MHVLQRLGEVAQGIVGQTVEAVSSSRSFRVFISNFSEQGLVLGGQSLARGSACSCEKEIPAGRAGLLRFSANGELGGAVEFTLRGERLLLGVHNPRVGSVSFSLEFSEQAERTPQKFYRALPKQVMGSSGAPSRATGKLFGAFASRAVQATDSSVHVVVGLAGDFQDELVLGSLTSRNCVLPGAASSSRLLEFAEWCDASSPETLGRAAFLSELAAMQAGLDELDLPDRALAADLLAAAFVEQPQVLGLPEGALKAELQAWQAVCKACRPVGRPAQFTSYRDLPTSTGELQQRTDAAVVLLQAAALQSAIAAGRAFADWSSSGTTGVSFSNNAVLWGDKRASSTGDSNTQMLVQHLDGARKSMFDPESRSRSRTSSFNPSISLPDFLQECIQVSADFEQRRAAVMEALIRRCPAAGSSVDSSLCHYAKWVPGQRRVFASEAHDGGLFESWGAEVFAGLDGGALTHPKQLIESLGHGAPPYTEMSTNSKSGEFFFFSGDRRFLIKTISQAEAQIFYRMLPGYQAHLRLGSSLIVRYGGLYRAQIPGAGVRFFTVMTSVFDTAYKVHETFDIKGSTFNRQKKVGESIGKDEDWIQAGQRLRVPPGVRRRLRAAHERDAGFFAANGLMDYSLLVGVHHVSGDRPRADAQLGRGVGAESVSGGLVSADGKDIYFAGLIDFLIFFGLRKEMESLMRKAQGHGEDASCVNPMQYAMRQVGFIQDSVLECYVQDDSVEGFLQDSETSGGRGEELAAAGGLGALRATVVAAQNLRNADLLTLSDPYTEVRVGLQNRRTPTVKDNLDPEWNCRLVFAVDEAHRVPGFELEVAVWDEDSVKGVQGDNDLLGRLRVPMERVIREGAHPGALEIKQKLQDAPKGELSLRLEFFPLSVLDGAPS